VIEQDWWAIERQQEMFAYEDDGYREVHVKTDGAVVMARRMLDELEEGEQLAQVQSQQARRTADLA
jgi:predicted deacylase